ncbi:MAG: hypothetical protein KME32_00490 [Mojavia pulchra JT2-VF2]|jgi:hypothetical protein|uniref:Uncharacterized protein n=1 Tax=Mojavia pulchra JT2-VF2 TaxID=287848 RepID=A0A951PTC9_9NOST|nr:hypothetical protein [Mojavia pulchra JT2-VF2]
MLKPVCNKTDEYRGYLQALDDFAIAELLAKLSDYCEPPEQETLAAVLITQLAQSLNSELIANYMSAIAQKQQYSLAKLLHQKFSPDSADLPEDFANTAKTPRFLYGDRLRWLGSDTDWGTVIGRFYSFAPHLCCWNWCYLIWLSKDSPSATWTSADMAWEEDLEPLEGSQL